MFLTRNPHSRSCRRAVRIASLLASLVVGAVLVGCSTQEKPKPDPVSQMPIVGDPALALRSDWPQSSAHYANGAVAAWSTRFPYDQARQSPSATSVFIEPAMFLGQSLLLPVELIVNPPFQPQVFYGVELPPSYTATPPLPPRGGVRLGQVVPFAYVGPTTPGAATPLAPAPTAGTPTGGPAGGVSQLPAFPAPTIPAAAPPAPPPGAPGSILGPPAGR